VRVQQNTRQGREGGALPKPLSDGALRSLEAHLVGVGALHTECCVFSWQRPALDVRSYSNLSSFVMEEDD
jgi:hypothetical protein